MGHRVAVKASIVNEKGEILVLKRSQIEDHLPGIWGLPGGKLKEGEDPFLGLKREVDEETGLKIEIGNPIRVHHFKHTRGFMVTLINFFCKAKSYDIKLNEEHDEFGWVKLSEAKDTINPAYHQDIDLINELFLKS